MRQLVPLAPSIGSLSTFSVLEYSHQEALTTAFFLRGFFGVYWD